MWYSNVRSMILTNSCLKNQCASRLGRPTKMDFSIIRWNNNDKNTSHKPISMSLFRRCSAETVMLMIQKTDKSQYIVDCVLRGNSLYVNNIIYIEDWTATTAAINYCNKNTSKKWIAQSHGIFFAFAFRLFCHFVNKVVQFDDWPICEYICLIFIFFTSLFRSF